MSTLAQTIREMPQRCAVAKLIGHCENIARSGALSLAAETALRKSIAETLAAFNMPSLSERGELEPIRQCMERTR